MDGALLSLAPQIKTILASYGVPVSLVLLETRFQRALKGWPVADLFPGADRLRAVRIVGATLRLLSGRVTSPTLLEQIRGLQALFPDMRPCVFEPSESDEFHAGQRSMASR